MPEIIRQQILSLCEEAENCDDNDELGDIIERIKNIVDEGD